MRARARRNSSKLPALVIKISRPITSRFLGTAMLSPRALRLVLRHFDAIDQEVRPHSSLANLTPAQFKRHSSPPGTQEPVF
jgi:hypothetical protein